MISPSQLIGGDCYIGYVIWVLWLLLTVLFSMHSKAKWTLVTYDNEKMLMINGNLRIILLAITSMMQKVGGGGKRIKPKYHFSSATLLSYVNNMITKFII